MRYRLRTLLIVTTVGPPLLAGGYWAALWLGARPSLLAGVAVAACLVALPIGLVLWYYELLEMIGAPSPAQSFRRKRRRVVRLRIERYVAGST
jgi:hypothetical protein